MFLKKICLSTKSGIPEALSNLGDRSLIEDVICNTLVDSKATDKFQLGKEVSDALNNLYKNTRCMYVRGWAIEIAKMRARNDNSLFLTGIDPYGNIKNLFIQTEGEFEKEKEEDEEISIHDFYIGSSYGSGIKCTTIDEFFDYLREEIKQRGYDGETQFNITIED